MTQTRTVHERRLYDVALTGYVHNPQSDRSYLANTSRSRRPTELRPGTHTVVGPSAHTLDSSGERTRTIRIARQGKSALDRTAREQPHHHARGTAPYGPPPAPARCRRGWGRRNQIF